MQSSYLTNKRAIISGAKLLAVDQLCTGVSRLARNILIARVLLPADFGIGATFTITITFLEMLSNFGLEQMLIQAKEGDDPRMLSTAHVIMVLRGVVIGLIIYLGAPLMARLFHIPDAQWAFRVLAVTPVIKGFTHLDIYRLQRRFRYGGIVTANLSATVFVTLAAWPVARWYGDYVALLWISLTLVTIKTSFSHLFRERAYRWGWEGCYVRQFLSFGWPLLLNGVLLFGTLQGDRTIVGSTYGVALLGVFTIAFQLTNIPTGLITGVSRRLALPLFSGVQDDRAAFNRHYRLFNELLSLVGGVLVVLFTLFGGWVIIFLYGQKYAEAGVIVGWLGAMQAMRLVRGLPSTASTAHGDTKNMLVSNIFRSVALLGSFVVAYMGWPIMWVAVCALGGEYLGYFVAIGRLKMKHGVAMGLSLKPASRLFAVMAVCLLTQRIFLGGVGWHVSGLVMLLFMVVYILVCVYTMPGVYAWLVERWLQAKNRSAVDAA